MVCSWTAVVHAFVLAVCKSNGFDDAAEFQQTHPGSVQEQLIQIPGTTQDGGGNVEVGLTRPSSSR